MTNARSERRESISKQDNDLWTFKPTGPNYTGCCIPTAEISFDESNTLVTRLSLDRQCFAVGLDTGAIKLYNFGGDQMKLVYTLPKTDEDTLSCTDIQFVPFKNYTPSEKKHLLVASYASGHAKIWHYTASTSRSRLVATFVEEKVMRPGEPRRKSMVSKNGKMVAREEENNQIMTCSVSRDGARFVTGGDDGCIRVYDIIERKEISRCYSTYSSDKMDGHVMRILAIQYHPRGESELTYSHIFISGGWDDSIQIWDDRYNHSIWQYFGPHICGSDALDIDPDQNHIITASWRRDRTILEIWKFNDEAVKEFEGTRQVNKSAAEYKQYAQPIAKSLQDKVTSSMGYVAKWLGDSYIIFGGSNQNILKIIDRTTFSPLGMVTDLPNAVYSVAFNLPDNITEKRPIRLTFCSGNKLFLMKLERK